MTDPNTQQPPHQGPTSIIRPIQTVLLVVVLSSAGAFSINACQEKQLGDDPIAMLLFGSFLAFTLGLARSRYPAGCGRRIFSVPFLAASTATMSGFFITASVDLYLHGGHNMLPFEFAFYLVYTGTGVATAMTTSVIGSVFFKKR
jgi:hypothetical protein